MIDKHKRSFAKAVSWRFLGTLVTMIIVFIFTGKLVFSIGVGILEATSKIMLFYLHERFWNGVGWGKKE
jgi:uncharacterized membrane protein